MPLRHPITKPDRTPLSVFLFVPVALLILCALSAQAAATEKVRVGINDFPPLAFIDDSGQARGMYVDLLEHIAAEEGWQLEYHPNSLSRLQEMAGTGEIDLIVPLAFSEERAERFDFPEQIVHLDWGVVVRSPRSTIETLPQLQGAEIAVVRGSLFTSGLRQHLSSFHIDARLVELESRAAVAAAVAAGTYEVGAINHTPAEYLENQFNFETTAIIYSPVHISIATREGHRPELLRTIDRHLIRLKSDPHSLFYRIQEVWLPHPHGHPGRYLAWGAILLAALCALVWLSLSLRRQVKGKISELVAANLELKESRAEQNRLNQQFQALLDGIPDHLLLISPDMQVVWMNRAAREQIGSAESSANAMPCYRQWAQSSGPCGGCPVAACFASGEAQETTMGNGGRVFGVKAFPIFGENGAVESVIKLAIDISDKVRLREESDRKNRLAAVGTLAAGVAHEINNPAGLILSNLELIAEAFDDAAPLLDERFRREGDFFFAGLPFSRMRSQLPLLLKESSDAARRIRQTVADLKDFARDGGTRDFADFSLTSAVERSLRLTDQLLRKATAHFTLDLAASDITLHGNARRIEQVLVNLLANACQALPDRSRAMTLATRYDADLQLATIVVRDEGVGIPAEDLPKLATPFFTTRQNEGGTGLGLSVSFGIVKEHGGTIHFASTPGKGTTVTVTLPATVMELAP